MSPLSADLKGTSANWPPEKGEKIAFVSTDGVKEGLLKEIRWGLVWRDFILQDDRIVPEHKVVGCPEPPIWRDPDTVSADERRAWEDRLIAMAEASMDPRDREQVFWADLTQYLAYTYLRCKERKDAGDH